MADQFWNVDIDEVMRAYQEPEYRTPFPPTSNFCQSPSGFLTVASTYSACFAMITLLVFVIPAEKVPLLTKVGVNSLYVYFGHMYFAVMPLMISCWVLYSKKIVLHPWLTLMFLLATLFGCATLLSQQWLRCFCSPFVEPDVETCCLRRDKDENEEDLS
mmetsp:Transcript_32008/g.49853  ORF Transcript_32008/g.49853 Transcript_32008/m.49853 type:complete len:159 (+) Transcript_32008:613-1089(+)